MTNFRALISRMANELDYYRIGKEGYDTSHPLAAEARTALAADQVVPEPVGVLNISDFRGLENVDFQQVADLPPGRYELFSHLAPHPVPEGPSDEELVQLAFREKLGRLDSNGNIITRYYYPMDIGENVIDFARAVLARWGNLAPEG